jgi:hypothetical protein
MIYVSGIMSKKDILLLSVQIINKRQSAAVLYEQEFVGLFLMELLPFLTLNI